MTDTSGLNRRDVLAGVAAGAAALTASEGYARARRPGPLSAATGFADAEIAAAARATGRAAPRVRYAVDEKLGAEGYRIEGSASTALTVTGGDATGAMYGGLDVAEGVRLGGETLAMLGNGRTHRPHIAKRGIKYNIPLDLRTPSYSDGSTSSQLNIPEVWSRAFWQAYFDEMARDRYNVLTLWSLHPFPSMVKVPEFADIALDDVWRSREPLDAEPLDFRGRDAVHPKFLANHEVVKKITIGEKIAFWRDVMQMAADRGIAVYVFTWNVFVYGTAGKYGIDDSMTNTRTVAYMRASVREMVTTYPLLAGIGITAGENLPAGNPTATQEQWLWSTYGAGISDALKAQPSRRFELVHRFHETEPGEIERNWSAYPGFPDSFTYSYKYSVAHMYSDPKPPFIAEAIPFIKDGVKTWLTVRNDDLYSFRWGDPDFAREYILNMPLPDKLVGFYMGPDGFNWGRDFLDRANAGKEQGAARRLVTQKQWYSFAMWGRLSYDPSLPDRHFEAMLAARFPGVDAGRLYAASSAASKIIPQVTQFFWQDIDLEWFPEACAYSPQKRPRGTRFYSVADFINGVPMPRSGILSIRRWRQRLTDSRPLDALSPLDVATALAGLADTTLDHVADLRTGGATKEGELASTLADYEAMAHLGRYYAHKIRGACDLALYDQSSRPSDKGSAVVELLAAKDAWRRYAAVRDAQYLPAFYNRIGYVDVTALTASAAKDVEIARTWRAGTITFDPNAPETHWEKLLPRDA
ncbi:carbohydrate-binding family 6 protein [Sphingomonas aerophila]|uniref:Carbohydrate-binding family 6 protein n=1 Tax=Sphingomonas aerophila TaxID=1344948 RepID=A0A7W9EVI9_9SPHN|nr:carbohydrate-binding family 6 protein [Sphingomonas aerophila]MBB5716374.1 hypothetical protein [Sphingomonas aerophila]